MVFFLLDFRSYPLHIISHLLPRTPCCGKETETIVNLNLFGNTTGGKGSTDLSGSARGAVRTRKDWRQPSGDPICKPGTGFAPSG
jgi:hypothetical protein